MRLRVKIFMLKVIGTLISKQYYRIIFLEVGGRATIGGGQSGSWRGGEGAAATPTGPNGVPD